jgi:hypothetical protein
VDWLDGHQNGTMGNHADLLAARCIPKSSAQKQKEKQIEKQRATEAWGNKPPSAIVA